jgi:hypothetical protein
MKEKNINPEKDVRCVAFTFSSGLYIYSL